MRRVVLGLCAVAAAFAGLVLEFDLGRSSASNNRAAALVFVCVVGVGYPVLGFFCKRCWWQPWRLALLGTVAGLLCAVPFQGGGFNFSFLLLTFGLAGLVLSLVFWGIAIWRNDELACPKSFCLPCGIYKVARKALLHRRDVV